MKTLDRFLIDELKKTFTKCNIGYYIDDVQTYNKAMASIRMQCYDMIEWLCRNGIKAELYKPLKKYDTVFFIKTRSERAVRIAKNLKMQGVQLIMYAYCEFIDDENTTETRERNNILKLTSYMDAVSVVGEVQYNKFGKYHSNVFNVGDCVHDDFFAVQKQHKDIKTVSIMYCGYSKKTKDILEVQEVIKKLQLTYACNLILLTDCNPEIIELDYEFVKYDQRNVANLFLLGDIMIAPRPMKGIEHLSHSNTKIAYPMAVGLPVVASPVPSYVDSPAILCSSQEEWYQALEYLILDFDARRRIGEEGRKFIFEHYSIDQIGQKYLEIIQG